MQGHLDEDDDDPILGMLSNTNQLLPDYTDLPDDSHILNLQNSNALKVSPTRAETGGSKSRRYSAKKKPSRTPSYRSRTREKKKPSSNTAQTTPTEQVIFYSKWLSSVKLKIICGHLVYAGMIIFIIFR